MDPRRRFLFWPERALLVFPAFKDTYGLTCFEGQNTTRTAAAIIKHWQLNIAECGGRPSSEQHMADLWSWLRASSGSQASGLGTFHTGQASAAQQPSTTT